MIKYEISHFIHIIHREQVIIYKKYNKYYVIDNDVYILRSLINYKNCYKGGRKVIFIDNNYLNYVLKKLRDGNIGYVIININYGYDRLLDYKINNSKYSYYYKKGKRLIKNEKKVKHVIDILNRTKNLELLKEVDSIINEEGCC